MMEARKDMSDDQDWHTIAYWGSVREEDYSNVRQEVVTFVPHEEAPGVRQSLTQVVLKAEIVPNKPVMSSSRAR